MFSELIEKVHSSIVTITLYEDMLDVHFNVDPDYSDSPSYDDNEQELFSTDERPKEISSDPIPLPRKQLRKPGYIYYDPNDDPTDEDYESAIEFVKYFDEKTIDDDRYESFFIQSLHEYVINKCSDPCYILTNKLYNKIKIELSEKYKLAKSIKSEQLRLHDMRLLR